MQAPLTLYQYWRSSCSWRVRWVLALKGLDYESVPINLLKEEQKTPEFLHINPSGNVPALMVGSKVLTESMAIIEWLDEVYPQCPVLPKDPWQRAEARELALMIAAGTQPLQNLKVTQHYSEDTKKREAWIQHFIVLGLTAFEAKLASHKGEYCLGFEVSLADIFLVPQVYNALRFQIEMRRFPRAEAIYKHCIKTDACEMAAPHRQPGAHP